MFKRVMLLFVSSVLVMNLSGCFLFLAGVAGGAGTAVWLSGKLTQEFHAPYKQTVDATRLAVHELNLEVFKETQEDSLTQIRGSYSDGKEMWIDIHRVSDNSTEVEVRVGGLSSEKEAASTVLKKIQSCLFTIVINGGI